MRGEPTMKRSRPFPALVLFLVSIAAASQAGAQSSAPPSLSGIYPHLSYENNEAECGTGGVVPWAGKLWVMTYGPHLPRGSSDKLYEIDDQLQRTIRPESVGGTPANRMIHRESQQLFMGPYAIDKDGKVRVIPYKTMPGRHTGNARHLTDPANKIYYATMEEGFYEVDVHTLEVKELYPDANGQKGGHGGALLPGYHGKGLYSSQGVLVYANNGELSPEAQRKPDIASGCLAEWDGKDWKVVRRNQFTEVTGPGGIAGNQSIDDPIWSIGWDHRSLILMLRDGGQWHSFRLPKASHSYDGAHGWNTEWPRIRDIGEADLLMTMHGAFWRFPKTFAAGKTAGIGPRSNYLKVIGDFCEWNGRVVLGCDDSAKSEFLNKRKAKGEIAAPGRSHSNLWFVMHETLDRLGPPIGRGAVWLNDEVKANTPSEPFLFGGFARRSAHLVAQGERDVTFTFEVDREGTGAWQELRKERVPAGQYRWISFPAEERGEWIRVRTDVDCPRATVFFTYAAEDNRPAEASQLFDGVAKLDEQNWNGGLVRARGDERLSLSYAATTIENGKPAGEAYYEMDIDLKLKRVENATDHTWLKENVKIPTGVLQSDAASLLIVTDGGQRLRLPKGSVAYDQESPLPMRIDREVCTERDLFNAGGTFFELPAENAGGFAKMRPVATHNRRITDYCSWRGLLILAGVSAEAGKDNPHILRSDDGKCAVWAGAVDDLWQFGKPRGEGGPWKDTAVKAGEPSDPYLMTGYDRKTLKLSHDRPQPVKFRVQVDISGSGDWQTYREIDVQPGEGETLEFPAAFQAYWLRVESGADCTATAWLKYE